MNKTIMWDNWFPGQTQTTLIDVVRNSDIPEGFKAAIYAKLSCYDYNKALKNTILKEKILYALATCDAPVRISGFFVNCPNAVFPGLSPQKVSSLLKELVDAGAVERIEVKSDIPLALPNGKTIFPITPYFAIKA